MLGLETEIELDALLNAVAVICDVPLSLINLVDGTRRWLTGSAGLEGVDEMSLDISSFSHALPGSGLFEVSDTLADHRFADAPWVVGEPRLRFCAAVSLRMSTGERIGILIVFDRQSRRLTDAQREALVSLSVVAARALETERATRRLLDTSVENAWAFKVLEHTADAVTRLSGNGLIEYWNPAAARLFGYDANAVIGQPIGMLMPNSGEKEGEACELTHLDEGHNATYETVRLHKDGTAISVSINRVLEMAADGTVLGATEFARDTTALDRAARELAQSSSDLRLVADNSASMMAYWNRDLTCRFANQAYRSWFARDPSDLVGKPIWELLGPRLFERNKPYIDAVLSGVPQRFEREIPGPDGSVRHSIADYTPDIVDGDVRGFLAQVTDVTPLKKSQLALRDTAAALEQAQRMSQIGSWEWHIASDTTTWSPELYRITGLPVSSKPPGNAERASFYTPESYVRWQEMVDRAIQFNESFTIEVEIVRPDGERRIVEGRAEPVVDAQGVVSGLRGTGQDITERRRSENLLRRSQNFLVRTGELAGVGGWEVDLVSGEVLWSDEVCRIHGQPLGHRPSLDQALGYYAAESQPRIRQAVEAAMAGGPGFDLELQIIHCDGGPRWVRAVGTVELMDGHPVRLAGAFQDITERHRLVARFAEQHELMRVTLQSIGDAVITTGNDACITWMNPVAERMTGWLAADAEGRLLEQVFHIIHEETRQLAENPVVACMREDKVTGLAHSTVLVSRNGQEFGIQDSASPIRNEHGEILGAVLVFNDVTEQRRLSGEMSYRATHDALTGLVNRIEFEVRLERAFAESKHTGCEHALMYLDLDQFKLVNDACGHAGGDILLQQVARVLGDTVRSRDTLARLGGDEFGVLLEHCTVDQAQRVAQQICDRMDEFRFMHDGKRFRVGASIGLVPVDQRWPSPAAIMQAADSSCYAAKEAGRNRVHVWFDTDVAMKARSGDMQWATRLEHALDEDRFVLYAQRIYPLTRDSSLLHAEVLIRMRDSDGSLIAPGAFLPAAERFNLASRIDKWVLRRTIGMLKELPDLDTIGMVCVNLSGQSVGDRAFHRKAFEMLEAAGQAICKCICIEITETAAITNMADATRFIEQAKTLGIRIALDDFGSGASSFGYLKSLHIDKLKIDGQFVRDVLTDPLDAVAVRCFVDVARVIDVRTVAEFVDSAAVLERIREMGIDYAQGYYLHKPERVEDVLGAHARRA